MKCSNCTDSAQDGFDLCRECMEAEMSNTTKLSIQFEKFICSLDNFDREYSMMRYDEAILKDALNAIRRIENVRRSRDKNEQIKVS